MSKPRIIFYFDCVSTFSYIGFEFMERYRRLWNIDVDYRPIILVEALIASKNMISLNKLEYLFHDVSRVSAITKIPFKSVPDKHPYDSTVVLRTLQYLKTHHPDKLVPAMRQIWQTTFVELIVLESVDSVKKALEGIVDANMVDLAIASDNTLNAIKKNLSEAREVKGFGTPTIVVYKTSDSKPEMYFGSDRFEHIAIYLEKEYYPMKQLFANAKV
ncbi:thioredoxin-like protein [Coemansia reversa NRRL 1564]|uniref:Glutathione S-transferase kappa n=1 Tax=Coemansia reversa (strain ATCC 12441 / NRRL 1564) TaxID=763665 RepID=A0A2G5B926_COERN|nr:thioredoxin-like protein [Coemansia reversa NRRL 1564]|eukprot:PIA15519.1 thioredoxin-like protein [Coemansia reversa NRRL 1564]